MAMAKIWLEDDDATAETPKRPRRDWEVLVWVLVTAAAIGVTMYRVALLLGLLG